jgi:hypothetical protein
MTMIWSIPISSRVNCRHRADHYHRGGTGCPAHVCVSWALLLGQSRRWVESIVVSIPFFLLCPLEEDLEESFTFVDVGYSFFYLGVWMWWSPLRLTPFSLPNIVKNAVSKSMRWAYRTTQWLTA